MLRMDGQSRPTIRPAGPTIRPAFCQVTQFKNGCAEHSGTVGRALDWELKCC